MVTGGDGYSNGYDSNGNGDDDGYYCYSYDAVVVVRYPSVLIKSFLVPGYVKITYAKTMDVLWASYYY